MLFLGSVAQYSPINWDKNGTSHYSQKVPWIFQLAMLVYRSVPCRGRSHIPPLESHKTIIFKSAKLHVPFTTWRWTSHRKAGCPTIWSHPIHPTPICRDSVDSVVRPQDGYDYQVTKMGKTSMFPKDMMWDHSGDFRFAFDRFWLHEIWLRYTRRKFEL